MRKLEKSFIGTGEVKNCLFTQVAKNEYGFIYSVTFEDYDKKGEFQKTPHHYEVFKLKITKGYDFEKKVSTDEEIESYPKANSFGVWAFTTHSYCRASDILYSFYKETVKQK
jgi:hypothetical protein